MIVKPVICIITETLKMRSVVWNQGLAPPCLNRDLEHISSLLCATISSVKWGTTRIYLRGC